MTSRRVGVATAALVCAAFALTGCASAGNLGGADVRALKQLSVIAPTGAEIDGAVSSTECWVPTEHVLSDDSGEATAEFRVLCRVHYVESSTEAERYRDMICIGDLGADPVTDHCYRWAYYTDMPTFEDHPGFAA